MRNTYFVWALEKWGKRILAYLVLLPVLIVLFPAYKAGDLLGRLFYRLA